jgi:hypothetical protein
MIKCEGVFTIELRRPSPLAMQLGAKASPVKLRKTKSQTSAQRYPYLPATSTWFYLEDKRTFADVFIV